MGSVISHSLALYKVVSMTRHAKNYQLTKNENFSLLKKVSLLLKQLKSGEKAPEWKEISLRWKKNAILEKLTLTSFTVLDAYTINSFN